MQGTSQATATTQTAAQPGVSMPATTLPATPAVLQPTRTIQTGPMSSQTRVFAASPDGRAVFLLTSEPSVNVWKSLVYLSPELLVALGMLAALVIMRRVAGRPQMLGEMHCRRCNYLLKNHAGERCPECGSPLNRRTTMRGARRNVRIALLSSIAALYAFLYFSNGLSRMRSSEVGKWFDWRTRSINGLMNHFGAVAAGRESLWVVTRIDLVTGLQDTAAIDARDHLKDMAVARDGRSIAVLGEAGVYRYEWPSGDRSAAVRASDTSVRKRWRNLLMNTVFTEDLRLAFVITEDGEVECWDLASGRTLRLFSLDPKTRTSNAPLQLMLPSAAGDRIVLVDRWYPPSLWVLSADNSAPPLRFDGEMDSLGRLAQSGLPLLVIPYQQTTNPNVAVDLMMVNLRDGRQLMLKGGSKGISLNSLTVLPERRWIIGEAQWPTRDLPVWDATTCEYAFVLSTSGTLPIAWLMPDDHHVVRVYANAATPTTPFHIDVFDLPGDSNP